MVEELAAGRIYDSPPMDNPRQCWADSIPQYDHNQCRQREGTDIGLCLAHYQQILGQNE